MNRDLRNLDRWIGQWTAEHPVLAWFWSIGIAVLIVELGFLFRWAVGQ